MTSQATTASLLHLMQEDDHPEREILDAVGDLSEFEWPDNSLLVGVYIQGSKTKSGLITATMSKASIYQGKVGLVLQMPLIPLPESEMKAWNGKPPKVGDWVVFNPDNGQLLSVCGKNAKPSKRLEEVGLNLYAGWLCRLIEAKYILGRIQSPRSVV